MGTVMTIPPIVDVQTPAIPPYAPTFVQTTNITPFTYRDGATYLQILEGLRQYINRTIVPFVNENLDNLTDVFIEEVNKLIDAVNEAIEAIINSSIEVQDPLVAQLINDVNSLTRQAIEGLNYLIKPNAARSVKEFGAVGNNVADDTVALRAAIASGHPLYWGGPKDIYRITEEIDVILASALVWNSDGASIRVDSVAPIQYALDINAAGFNITIKGPMTIDSNLKAFTSWYFHNNSATYANISLSGVGSRRNYRANTNFLGGDGIMIKGAFTNVYLERPDVRDSIMAANAGIIGSQGVTGITVSAAGVGLSPKEITLIAPWIENVYCEDPAYLADQDGFRVFTEEDIDGNTAPFETHFAVFGGHFKNCAGRSIKSQCEFGVVDGAFFIRRGTTFPARIGGYSEINFQTGGGSVVNCEFEYISQSPSRVIQWTGTHMAGGKFVPGFTINNCKVTITGSQAVPRFFAATNDQQRRGVANISNVHVITSGTGFTDYFSTVQGLDDTQEIIINLSNIIAPLETGLPFLQRLGVATPTYSSFTNIVNTRSLSAIAKFSILTQAGAYTQVVSGNNVRVEV
jgi:hypothetical protein